MHADTNIEEPNTNMAANSRNSLLLIMENTNRLTTTKIRVATRREYGVSVAREIGAFRSHNAVFTFIGPDRCRERISQKPIRRSQGVATASLSFFVCLSNQWSMLTLPSDSCAWA